MIKVSHLRKSFGGNIILRDINLNIAKGEVLVLLGESGTGKSVLLRHLIGLIKPDKGCIELNSIDITSLPEKDLLKIRKDIGYLFQESALYDFMTVFDNIAFPLREHTNFSKELIKDKVKKSLKLVDLRNVEKKYPSELSGGMKKRVALARCIVLDSKILFCDEPTSGLDPRRSRDISDLIKNVSRKLHCTTVVTSHDVKNSLRIADRLAIIYKGKVVAVGTKEQLLNNKDQYVQEYLSC